MPLHVEQCLWSIFRVFVWIHLLRLNRPSDHSPCEREEFHSNSKIQSENTFCPNSFGFKFVYEFKSRFPKFDNEIFQTYPKLSVWLRKYSDKIIIKARKRLFENLTKNFSDWNRFPFPQNPYQSKSPPKRKRIEKKRKKIEMNCMSVVSETSL